MNFKSLIWDGGSREQNHIYILGVIKNQSSLIPLEHSKHWWRIHGATRIFACFKKKSSYLENQPVSILSSLWQFCRKPPTERNALSSSLLRFSPLSSYRHCRRRRLLTAMLPHGPPRSPSYCDAPPLATVSGMQTDARA